MDKLSQKVISCFLIFCMMVIILPVAAFAAEDTDTAVQSVIEQLEAIDSLQTMQNNRSSYTVSSRYNVNTTDTAIISAHETARAGYEGYVNEMFAARIAAQQAYNALSDEQKAQIDSDLVAKLDDELSTVFNSGTYSVSPREDEYSFEAVDAEFGYAYEVSNHMVSGNIPQTFILVDTSDGATTWTPSGKYVYGESNYDVTYCCDVQTGLEYGSDYKRINLEDSNYYGDSAARHIRAILQNSYPYVTINEMKDSLRAGGLDSDFVADLTRADIIAAVQMAVWTYANAEDGAEDGLGYFASVDVTRNIGAYFTPLHDYSNESWDWYPGKRLTTYDARAAYRVNNLAYYLCNLPGVEATDDQIIISDVKVARAELIAGEEDIYNIGLYVYLNEGVHSGDNITITASSYSQDSDVATGRTSIYATDDNCYALYVKAKYGDTIKVVVEGTQYLSRGVYFYEPEGGRDVSQCLVGVAEGATPVKAEMSFVLQEDIEEKGLRIYKTENGTDLPISDIVFNIYKVLLTDGESLSEKPTAEEIALYATAENLTGTVTTDSTGYASIALDEGTYLIVEEENSKVKEPVDPFYIQIPMTVNVTSQDGTITAETYDIVSIYPKNEPVEEPEEPPVNPPTPDQVTGSFEILKYDALDNDIVLEGAQFEVYRAATESDADSSIVVCDGVQYAVIPVMVNGEKLVLTTDENGTATSPELTCGTYFLVETEAPRGYQLLDEAVSVTVISGTMTVNATVEIPNEPGRLLPETGGIGTTWMLVIGGCLVAGATILLVTKKRMRYYE